MNCDEYSACNQNAYANLTDNLSQCWVPRARLAEDGTDLVAVEAMTKTLLQQDESFMTPTVACRYF